MVMNVLSCTKSKMNHEDGKEAFGIYGNVTEEYRPMLMSFVSQEQCQIRSILPNLATPGGAVSRQLCSSALH
jgi:hypothetical protein